jgi:hypothetical protein
MNWRTDKINPIPKVFIVKQKVMKNVRNHIENIVSQVLQETIEERANSIIESVKNKISEESYGDTEQDGVAAYGDFSINKPKVGKVKNSGYNYEKKVSKEFNETEETNEQNAFILAADEAKEKGKKEFEFPKGSGKMHPVTIQVDIDENRQNRDVLTLTEDELIELIEQIVNEQSEVKSTNKSMKATKEENDDYIKSVTKKMKTYLKDASKGTYEMSPKHFPKGNGELAKMTKKAYVPSKAVEEYEDAFSYPGQTNLRYDEIAPNDEVIEKYLEGDSSTGNSQEYGNAVASDAGKKFMKNYKENLYGAEQADASYKRQPQPVDLAGDDTSDGNLKSKRGGKKSSAQKAADILNQLESIDEKKSNLIKEDMEKMKKFLNYKQKTQ